MRKLLRRALVFLVTLGIALIAAEWVVARWFPLDASMYRLDGDLIYVPRPGARGTKVAGPDGARRWVTTEFNAQGHRGPEFDLAKPRPRVVVYGDSFVLAEDVEEEHCYVARLRAELAAHGPLDVINSGVKGYGPDQECLRFEREVGPLKPDLAIFVLYSSNDYGDLVRNKLFRLDEAGHAVANGCALAPTLVAEFERQARAAARPALLRAIDGYVAAGRRRAAEAADQRPPYIEWYLRSGADEYAEYVVEGNSRVRQVWEDFYDADVALHPEWPSAEYKVRLMRAVVERMQSECARRRVALFVLIVPSAVDLSPGGASHVDPRGHATWSPSRLTDVLEVITTELGVPHVNLYAPFRAVGPESVYIGDGNLHWNENGQALAARLTAEVLARLGLWPPTAPR